MKSKVNGLEKIIYTFSRTIFTAIVKGIAWIVSEIIKIYYFHDFDLRDLEVEWRPSSI